MIEIIPSLEDGAIFGLANSKGKFHERIEHGLQVESRAADDLEHVGCRCLLLQRFAEFCRPCLDLVEKADVLDRDHGLVGEGLQQRNLPGREKPGPRPGDIDGADRATVLEHWHCSDGAGVGGLRHVANCVVRIRLDVGYLLDLPAHHRPASGAAATGGIG